MKSQKGSKDLYHILNSSSIKLKCEEKWIEALKVILNWKEFIVCLSLQQKVQNYSGFNIELFTEF